MPEAGKLATRATALTLLRLALVPLLVWAIAAALPLVAAAAFWLAVASDFADGWVARRYAEATPFGGVLDHAVDATLASSACAALAWQGALPTALAPLVALAFVQYLADSRVVTWGGLRGSRLGRWNGIAYYVAVGVPVTRDALGLAWPSQAWLLAGGWLLVASTLFSMLDRFRWFVLGRRARGSRAAGTAARSPR